MISLLRSVWAWSATAALVLLWLPAILVVRMFDRTPARLHTGLFFRRLGVAITRVNPSWRFRVVGEELGEKVGPCVVVSNHQSLADIPLISNLPWEMKWLAKAELFKMPFVGWMMSLAGDIPVNRQEPRSAARAMRTALRYLQVGCPVMIFPEGTRSLDGRVQQFHSGAFLLAIKAGVPVLPLVIEGSRDCLPKKSLKLGPPREIVLHILSPIEASKGDPDICASLRDRVRRAMLERLATLRGVSIAEVEATPPGVSAQPGASKDGQVFTTSDVRT